MLRRQLARAFWSLGPWELVTQSEPTRRTVLIGAPHTSNWDFVLAPIRCTKPRRGCR